VVDESKIVESLGVKFAVPVEVISEARVNVTLALERLGAEVNLRQALRKAGPVITDHGNLLLDIRFSQTPDPVLMEKEINLIPGVVENGFFTSFNGRPPRPVVFIARADGTVERRQ
jgi:ribose 5-phosphate isomerase A